MQNIPLQIKSVGALVLFVQILPQLGESGDIKQHLLVNLIMLKVKQLNFRYGLNLHLDVNTLIFRLEIIRIQNMK
jgi:hypothetical protein